ncbi:MAG: type II toxin-antitoxin system VapC family toxin [Mycobacteriales bacterium]
MRLLLDTHALLWWFNQPEKLTQASREAIAEESNDVLVSAASMWEAGIKRALGRLEGADDLGEKVLEQRLGELPISFRHAEVAAELPGHHGDPFDRMLIAQAMCESLTFVTRDARAPLYDVAVLKA